MFQNPEIALENLPAAEDLDWRGLYPRFVRRMQVQRFFVVMAISVASTTAILVLSIPVLQSAIVLIGLVVFGALILSWPIISVPRRGFVVRDKDIVYRFGVFWRSVTAVPFNRIQHVETSSTPFDRKFDVATLQLFTAGGSGGDLRIDGLHIDTAEKLRLHILTKTGSSIENA